MGGERNQNETPRPHYVLEIHNGVLGQRARTVPPKLADTETKSDKVKEKPHGQERP